MTMRMHRKIRKNMSRMTLFIRGACGAMAAFSLFGMASASFAAGQGKEPATVKFGRYFADGKGESAEPIEWLVLDEKDGKSLLVTARVIDSRPFHGSREAVTWDNCDLRKWLNGAFLETAFSAGEREAIAETDLPAIANPRFETPAGNPTRDRVFLMSYEECLKYMPEDKDRKCFPTAYAIARGCYVNTDGHAAWWLRSNGMSETEPEHLATWGNFSLRHHHVDDPILGDRPCLWVDSARLAAMANGDIPASAARP